MFSESTLKALAASKTLLTNKAVIDALGFSAERWQRMRASPEFPEPVFVGRKLLHRPAELVTFLRHVQAMSTAKSLAAIARELHVTHRTLKNWAKNRTFPPKIGERFEVPVFDPVAVKRWVREYLHDLPLPPELRKAKPPPQKRRRR